MVQDSNGGARLEEKTVADPGIPLKTAFWPQKTATVKAGRLTIRAGAWASICHRRPKDTNRASRLPVRGVTVDPVRLHELMTESYPPGVEEKLADSTVGIAGAGGLGSAVALSLARANIGRLIIADFDLIEARNLNRQHYFIDQVGRPKVHALKRNLEMVNPWVEVTVHETKVTRKNVAELFGDADVIVEAFDAADQKLMLIETVLMELPDTSLVAASGLGGYGNNEGICTQRSGRLHICGDMRTEADEANPPMAPRVGVVASLQANRVLEILLDGTLKAGGDGSAP